MSQITRREPVGSLIDELFSDFFIVTKSGTNGLHSEGLFMARPGGGWQAKTFSTRNFCPPFVPSCVTPAALRAINPVDIQVSIDGPRVSITAENKAEREVKNGEKLLHTERFATSYARSFELPVEVTEEGADAAFENGVLRLTLPKRAQVMSKRLAVR